MDSIQQWFAVYTKPRWEKKTALLLKEKQLEVYCPLRKTLKQWADRKKLISEPLFTSYVFVHICDAERISVCQTRGVLNFVYWLGKPAIIRDEEIKNIRDFLSRYTDVKVIGTYFKVNDKITITRGPFSSMEGSVVEVHRRTVKILIPSLGIGLVAEVCKSDVEVEPLQHSSG